MKTITPPPVHRIAWIQLVIAVSASLLFFLADEKLGRSVLVGTFIQIVPQAYFTRMAFRHTGARQASSIVQGFYLGESGKLILAALLFALAFTLIENLHYGAVFISYTLMILVHGVCATFAIRQKKQKH